MSGHLAVVPAAAVTDERVGSAALRVLLVLGSHTDKAGWCRVKQATVASLLGVGRTAVVAHLAHLADLGYVEVKRTGRSSVYRVVLNLPIAMSDEVTSAEPAMSENVTSDVRSEVTSDVSPRGDIDITTVSNDVLQRKPLGRSATTKTPKAERIPEPFRVTTEMVAWAKTSVPHVDLRTETAKFVDHWRAESGQKSRKLDWPAAWRNWMRNADQRLGRANGHAPPLRQSVGDANLARLRARQAEREREQANGRLALDSQEVRRAT